MDLLTREKIRKAGSLLMDVSRPRPAPRLHLARLISDLAQGRAHGGEDREALEEYARQAGIAHYDPQRPMIPFSELALAQRDLTAGVAVAGGYLVASETPEAVDILRPWSVSARSGAMVETGLVGNQVVPKTTTKSTGYWLQTEGTQVTASQPTVGQIALTPKTVGGLITFSRQLSLQANAQAFTARELLRTIGTMFDQAVLNGSGASGQPTGLLNTAGIITQSGTSLGHAGVCNMKERVATANAPDTEMAFVGTPEVRELLETREVVTGAGRFIWADDRVAGRPGYVSTDVPSATLICTAWASTVYIGIWGQGFVIEINPFDPTGFKAGAIQARLLVSMDVAILHPAAVCVSTSIT